MSINKRILLLANLEQEKDTMVFAFGDDLSADTILLDPRTLPIIY